ncbi:MAG TPA: GRP family sugar transporter, partial [Chitinophagaceae bacterium]|nr:GRP family sugar transporter [Chitinophagaceae bacterium]
AILLNARAYTRIQAKVASPSARGLVIAILAGLLMGFFYRFVAQSMFKDFNVPEAGKLSPYTVMVIFAVGILLSNIVFNTYIMRRPFTGQPVHFSAYFSGGWRNHLTGLLGGIIWCVGMSFSIIASGKAGAAISYGLGQGATVVAAIWGIFVWKEFKSAPSPVPLLLNSMLVLYVLGIAFIIYAR